VLLPAATRHSLLAATLLLLLLLLCLAVCGPVLALESHLWWGVHHVAKRDPLTGQILQ
jgi:hypothetical protein